MTLLIQRQSSSPCFSLNTSSVSSPIFLTTWHDLSFPPRFNLGEGGRQGWGRTALYAINRRKKLTKVFKHGPTAVPNDRFLSDSDWRSKRSRIWSRFMYPYRRISFIFEAQLLTMFFSPESRGVLFVLFVLDNKQFRKTFPRVYLLFFTFPLQAKGRDYSGNLSRITEVTYKLRFSSGRD